MNSEEKHLIEKDGQLNIKQHSSDYLEELEMTNKSQYKTY